MKNEKIITLGDVEIIEVDKGIYMSYIDVDGARHTILTSDPMSGLDFIFNTKEDECAGKMTTEDLIEEDESINLSYGEIIDGLFQINVKIMDRTFDLTLSDKRVGIRLLKKLASKPVKCLFDEYICLAAREAIKIVKKNNR